MSRDTVVELATTPDSVATRGPQETAAVDTIELAPVQEVPRDTDSDGDFQSVVPGTGPPSVPAPPPSLETQNEQIVVVSVHSSSVPATTATFSTCRPAGLGSTTPQVSDSGDSLVGRLTSFLDKSPRDTRR